MQTAKLFNNGQSQAVRLPKDFRFIGEEVGIKKIGDIVLLYPTDEAFEKFLTVEPISDDFADSILQARADSYPDIPRESL